MSSIVASESSSKSALSDLDQTLFRGKNTADLICSGPMPDVFEIIDLKRMSGCTPIAGMSSKNVPEENFAKYIPSYNDPLMAPLDEIGGTNHKSCRSRHSKTVQGHTFSKDGGSPICSVKLDNRIPDSEPLSPESSVCKLDEIDPPCKVDGLPANEPVDPVNGGGERRSSMITRVLGPYTPVLVDVKLVDIGESLFFTDNWYLGWRIMYFVACIVGVTFSLTRLDGPACWASCFGMTFAAIHSMVILRRVVQVRLLKRSNLQDRSIMHQRLPFSWLEVMTIQAAPVVCIMIGFILPVIFNAVIESHGLAVSYYRSVTFYMTVCVIMLTLLDMWIGSVPTRILYVLFSTVLCCAIAYGAAHTFRRTIILWVLLGMFLGTIFTGTLLHIIVRSSTTQDDDWNGEERKEDEAEGADRV